MDRFTRDLQNDGLDISGDEIGEEVQEDNNDCSQARPITTGRGIAAQLLDDHITTGVDRASLVKQAAQAWL
jgi:hypothetical protein